MSNLKGDLAPKPTKTPYELRVEILHLAQHIVEDTADKTMAYLHTQSDIANSFRDRFNENQNADTESKVADAVKANLEQIKMPTMGVDEVLNIAKKLNDFVSNG